MKRQTILTILVVLLVVGMVVAVDPVAASEQDTTVIVASFILIPKLNSADTGEGLVTLFSSHFFPRPRRFKM